MLRDVCIIEARFIYTRLSDVCINDARFIYTRDFVLVSSEESAKIVINMIFSHQ